MSGLHGVSIKCFLRWTLAGVLVAVPALAAAQCADALPATDRLQSTVAAEATAREALITVRRNAQDWKNLLLRGRDAAERETMQTRFDTQARRYEAQLAELRQRATTAGLALNRVDLLDAERIKLFERYRAALARHGVATLDAAAAADRDAQGADVATFRTLEQLIETFSLQSAAQFQALRTAIGHCGAPASTARPASSP